MALVAVLTEPSLAVGKIALVLSGGNIDIMILLRFFFSSPPFLCRVPTVPACISKSISSE